MPRRWEQRPSSRESGACWRSARSGILAAPAASWFLALAACLAPHVALDRALRFVGREQRPARSRVGGARVDRHDCRFRSRPRDRTPPDREQRLALSARRLVHDAAPRGGRSPGDREARARRDGIAAAGGRYGWTRRRRERGRGWWRDGGAGRGMGGGGGIGGGQQGRGRGESGHAGASPLQGRLLFDAQALVVSHCLARREGAHFLGSLMETRMTGTPIAVALAGARVVPRDVTHLDDSWRRRIAYQLQDTHSGSQKQPGTPWSPGASQMTTLVVAEKK